LKEDDLKNNSPTENMSKLGACRERFELYEKLDKLLDEEYSAIINEELNSLQKLLQEQDELLQKIKKQDEVIVSFEEPAETGENTALHEEEPGEAGEIRYLTYQLLENIKEKRERNRRFLQEKYSSVGEKLQTVQKGKKTASAYRSLKGNNSSFLDKKR